jgi:hypothetical protein
MRATRRRRSVPSGGPTGFLPVGLVQGLGDGGGHPSVGVGAGQCFAGGGLDRGAGRRSRLPGTTTQTLRLEEDRRRDPRLPRTISSADFRRGTPGQGPDGFLPPCPFCAVERLAAVLGGATSWLAGIGTVLEWGDWPGHRGALDRLNFLPVVGEGNGIAVGLPSDCRRCTCRWLIRWSLRPVGGRPAIAC